MISINQPIIELQNIIKSYQMGNQRLTVLNQVSLTVYAGEFVAILGPSGSGKSTLMNLIGCIDTADSGTFVLNGESIANKKEDELAYIRNQMVGFVFQRFNLMPKYTAIHNVAFPLLLRGEETGLAYEKAALMLDKVGLSDRITHKPSELSGGQQQRVSIARALVVNPGILLADEPTGTLDSVTGEEIMQLFMTLHNEGHTIVLITHDLNIAAKASRIISVKDGLIVNETDSTSEMPS